jgi:hypothetical protein
MLSWLVPTMLCIVRAFLSLAGYYRGFIRGYGAIASPLTKLLKKDGFHWTSEANDVFWALQHTLTSAPVLQLLAFVREFII